MQFHEQLDYLMKLTDISNSELSKRANIDPSLVSRWRRGLKRPEVFSDIVSHIAEILAQRINSDLRRREFAAWLSLPVEELSEPEEITSAVLECFHKNASRPDLKPRKSSSKRPYPTYEQRQVSPLDPYSLPEAHRFGRVGRKQALSWVLSFVEYWTQDSGTLRFYSDQPYEYLNIDCGYYEKRFQEYPYAEKFRIVKILQPTTATEQERLRVLQFAFLFMNTSTVSIAFIPQKEVSIFQHSLGIYDNQMAICSYGFYGSRYTSSYIHADESFVHELTNDFDTHFDCAQIALQPIRRFNFQTMHRELTRFYADHEALYYAGEQLFLPFLPTELLALCAQQLDAFVPVPAWAAKAERDFLDFLREHKVFATFPLLAPENFENSGAPHIFLDKVHKFTFAPEQYLAILRYVLELYRSCENLELSFLPMDPDICLWANGQRLILVYTGYCFVPYRSEHPSFVRMLYKIHSTFFQEHLKEQNRVQTRQQLEEAIRQFGAPT